MAELAQAAQNGHQESPNDDRVLFTAEIIVSKHYSKKNSKVISYRRGRGNSAASRPFIRTTNEARMAEEFLVLSLQSRARELNFSSPIDIPVRLLCVLQLPQLFTQKRTINLRSGDASNLVQGPEDALTKAGIIIDDSLITDLQVLKEWGVEHKITLSLSADSRYSNYPKQSATKKRTK
jgi:Holliday junction resolvase RusA-like endonuclease